MWPSYYHLMEPNAVKLVKEVFEEGGNGNEPLDTFPGLRQVRLFELWLGCLRCASALWQTSAMMALLTLQYKDGDRSNPLPDLRCSGGRFRQ